MSEADELEKLHQLKLKGALTEEEFLAKKTAVLGLVEPKVKNKSSGLVWKVPLILFILIVGIAGVSNSTDKIKALRNESDQSKVSCDTDLAKNTLKKAFDQSQFARTLNLSVIQVTEPKEESRDDKRRVLLCRATVMLNNTESVVVSYKLETSTDDKFLLTFEVIEANKNASVASQPPKSPPLAQAVQTPDASVEKCVANRVKKFRESSGEDALVRNDMLDEWEAECKVM